VIDIDAIRARLVAATPGPWYVDESLRGVEAQTHGYPVEIVGWTGLADAMLIAHAPGDIAALVAEVERLRAWAEEAAKAENANADDAVRERAAVVAWLRARRHHELADTVERGGHRREGEP
jgi:hypothetical protein